MTALLYAALLYTVFFASGASALIFETLWFRQAGLALGNSVWASSLVLAGFMGGLALGNAVAARYGGRLGNPVRAYAAAEAVIAITGVGLVSLFPILGVALAPWFGPLIDLPWILNPLRLVIAFLLLLIPSTAMGITLPLLTKALMGHDPHFGAVLGRLYGWNTLGAVVGVIVAETYLVGAYGVRGTALLAGTLNMLVAAVSLWIATRTRTQDPSPSPSPDSPGAHRRALRGKNPREAGRRDTRARGLQKLSAFHFLSPLDELCDRCSRTNGICLHACPKSMFSPTSQKLLRCSIRGHARVQNAGPDAETLFMNLGQESVG